MSTKAHETQEAPVQLLTSVDETLDAVSIPWRLVHSQRQWYSVPRCSASGRWILAGPKWGRILGVRGSGPRRVHGDTCGSLARSRSLRVQDYIIDRASGLHRNHFFEIFEVPRYLGRLRSSGRRPGRCIHRRKNGGPRILKHRSY